MPSPSRKQAAAAQQLAQAIRPGQSIELLQHLHILTREGALNQDARRKLKQVYHLYGFIEHILLQLIGQGVQDFTLADHGAGKSYLGFIVYDLFLKSRPAGRIFGIESRAELVQRSRELAASLGFERMAFLAQTVQQATHDAQLPPQVDVVTALHACDTATDDAIAFALQRRARHLVLVPCCQAEAATHLRAHKAQLLARTPLAELWRHALHTREFGSHLTNVMRCLYLQSQGYSVTVTELVGWEHSLKNELIVAQRTPQPQAAAARRMREIAQQLGLEEWLQKRFARVALPQAGR